MDENTKSLVIQLQAETISAYKTINVLLNAIQSLTSRIDALEQALKPPKSTKSTKNDKGDKADID